VNVRFDQYLDDLRKRVLQHPAVEHPLLQAFASGSVTWPQARRFGLLYYAHIVKAPLYRAAAMSITPDERVQLAYNEILNQEYGHGDEARTRPALYRRFLRALDWAPQTWESAEVVDAQQHYAQLHYKLCTRDWLTAAGAAGFAMEWPIPAMHCKLVHGLRRLPQLDDRALDFFTCRQEHDLLLREVITPHLFDHQARERLEVGILLSLEARRQLLDGLWAAIDQE